MQITKSEAAKILGVSLSHFSQRHSANLKDIGLGKIKLYDKEEVVAYKERLIEEKKSQVN